MIIAIVTGASSGMGKEFAKQIDKKFEQIDQIWLVARNKEKLTEVANSLHHKTRVFAMDITNAVQQERLESAVKKNNAKVRILVNCAGYGIMGPFATSDRKDETGMIRVNCEALTNITHRMIPYMKRGSRIIQLASCAAFLPQTNFAVYAATKAYVHRFSQALAMELKPKGIYVTSVCPGPVDTPFFEIAEQNGSTLAIKKHFMVSAEQVVKKALKDAFAKKTKSVYSLPIQAIEVIAKVLPHNLILHCMKLMEK